MMGKAAQTPGLVQVFSLFETQTPQLYLEIDRIKAELLGINAAGRVQHAADLSSARSYVNDFNLFGRTFRVQAQAASPYRLDPQDRAQSARAQFRGRTVPLGSFTTVRDIAGPFRVPRYNIYPAAELDGPAAPGYLARAGDRDHGEARQARCCRRASSSSGRHLAYQQIRAGNTAAFAFRARRGVRVPGAGRAVRKPDAAARGRADRADVPCVRDHRRAAARAGQQHSDPGRLRRAHRACRQERDSDRRVRAPAGRSGPRSICGRGRSGRICASGRS